MPSSIRFCSASVAAGKNSPTLLPTVFDLMRLWRSLLSRPTCASFATSCEFAAVMELLAPLWCGWVGSGAQLVSQRRERGLVLNQLGQPGRGFRLRADAGP